MRTTSTVWALAGAFVSALLALGLAAPRVPSPQGPSDVRVRVYVRPGVVKLGGRAALVIDVENGRRAEVPALPQVDGLAIGPLPAPSHSTSSIFTGARMVTTETWSWVVPVLPERAGEFTVPPFDVRVDGATYRSRPLPLTAVSDLRGEELGLLEMEVSDTELVEGEPFTIELRFGWDLGLDRQIDYVNLSLPWWDALPGVLEMEEAERGFQSRRLEVNVNRDGRGSVEELGRQTVRGRDFRMFRLRRTFLPSRSGTLELPQSFLEFRQVLEPGGGTLFDRRPARTEMYYVSAPAVSIRVDPLPEDGRPYDFTGAVGTFAARAEADRRDVDVGESIKLTVEWSGRGNFEFFEVPDLTRLDAFADFRAYGVTERKGADHRVAVYDLAPASAEIDALPPVPLTVFDPERRAYVTVATEPIPIRVRAVAGQGLDELGGAAGPRRDVRDVAVDARARARRAPLGAPLVLAPLALAPVGWIALRTFVRRRRGDPDAPLERRRRAARRRLARSLRAVAGAEAQLEALAAFLGARTRQPDQAWIGRDPRELAANGRPGVDAAALEPLARVVADLEREAWAGEGRPLEHERILAAADAVLKGGL